MSVITPRHETLLDDPDALLRALYRKQVQYLGDDRELASLLDDARIVLCMMVGRIEALRFINALYEKEKAA